MTLSIFGMRWYGIKGQTIGEGKFEEQCVRVQTSKDGPWQALNDKELEQLLVEHNQKIEKAKAPEKAVKEIKKALEPKKKMKAKAKAKK